MGVLEAGIGQAEMIEAGDPSARAGDIDAGRSFIAGIVELAASARLVDSGGRSPPGPGRCKARQVRMRRSKRPPDAGGKIRMAATHLLKNRDGPQTGRGGKQRHDLGIPDRRQRIKGGGALGIFAAADASRWSGSKR